MNPVSEDIKDLLVTAQIGTFGPTVTTGWKIFVGTEPAKPNTTITIYDTGGQPDEYCADVTKKAWEKPSFQVRVRGTTYLEVHKKLIEIKNAIAHKGSFVIESVESGELDVKYFDITVASGPLSMGQDENNRFIFTMNYNTIRQEIAQ